MKNTAAKLAGQSRAESALQPRDVKSPLVASTTKKEIGQNDIESSQAAFSEY